MRKQLLYDFVSLINTLTNTKNSVQYSSRLFLVPFTGFKAAS